MKKLIKKLLSFTGYTITRLNIKKHPQQERQVNPKHFFDMYFARISPSDFFFMQIGANDGKTEDLLHDYILKYKLAGILVEPQQDVFEKLKETYKNQSDLIFANMAIGHQNGTMPFYKLKPSLINDSNYYQATSIASPNKETLKGRIQKRVPKNVISYVSENLDDYIEETEIKTSTFDALTNKYHIDRINFIFIDCEGYDYEIIKMINFQKFTPDIIYYESIHLSDKDRAECEGLLESKGYQIFRTVNDTCAFI